MQRRIADISTRFRVEGLGSAQREIQRFTKVVGSRLRDLSAHQAVGLGPTKADMRAYDAARKADRDYGDWWEKQLAERDGKEIKAAGFAAKQIMREKEAAEKLGARVQAVTVKAAIRAKAAAEKAAAREALAASRTAAREKAATEKAAARDAAVVRRETDRAAAREALIAQRNDAKRIAGEERNIARDLARQKRLQDADYAAFWKQQVAQEEAAKKASAKAIALAERAATKAAADAERRAAKDSVEWRKQRARAAREFGAGMQRTGRLVVTSMRGITTATTATARGFTSMSRAGIRAAHETGAAMARLTAQVARVGTTAVSAGARMASGLVRRGVQVGVGTLLGGGVGGLFLKNAMKESQEYIQQQERVANVLGLSIGEFSEFAAMAQYSALSIDDLRQAMTQFLGVAGQAGQSDDNAYAKAFAAIGMSVKDATGKVRPFLDLIQEFAVRSQALGRGERAGLLTQIFGDDDATKVGRFLDTMSTKLTGTTKAVRDFQRQTGDLSGGRAGRWIENPYDKNAKVFVPDLTPYEKQMQRLRQLGGVVTDQDLALSREYRTATTELSQSFKGLQLEIFRAFGPTMIGWVRFFTNALVQHRQAIVKGLVSAYNTILVFGRDVVKVFFGIETGYAVQHMWLIRLKQGAIALGKWMHQTWTRMPVYLDLAKQAVQKIQKSFFDLKAKAVEAFEAGMQKVERFRQGIEGFVDSARNMWSVFNKGIDASAFSQVEGVIFNVGAGLAQTTSWVSQFAIELHKVIALGQDAGAGFEWLNSVRDWLVHLYESAKIAISWFAELAKGVNAVLGVFGTDLTTLAMFIGIAKFTGLFGPMVLAIKTGIGWIRNLRTELATAAAVNVAVDAAAGAGLVAGGAKGGAKGAARGLGGLTGSMAGLAGTVAKSAASFTLWSIAIGAAIEIAPTMVEWLYTLGKSTVDWMKGTTSSVQAVARSVEEANARIAANLGTEAKYIKAFGAHAMVNSHYRRREIEREFAWMSGSEAERVSQYVTAPNGPAFSSGGSDPYGFIDYRASAAYPQRPVAEPVATATFNLKGGRTATGTFPPSDLDALIASGAFERA